MHTSICNTVLLTLLLSASLNVSAETRDNLIDGPIFPGQGDEYTEQANKIVEDVIISGVSATVLNAPVIRWNPRSSGSPTNSPEQCLNTSITNGHTIATFATTGGLRQLYKWATNQKGWEFSLNDYRTSALAIAIEENLLYMAKDIWASGHPFAYNKDGYGLALSYMVDKKWPLRGFEAAVEAGEAFNDSGTTLYDTRGNTIFRSRPRHHKSGVIEYLRAKETHPDNTPEINARLQTLINTLEAMPRNTSITPLAELQSVAKGRYPGACNIHNGIAGHFKKALNDGVISEKVASSFNIHGRPLIHYLINMRLHKVATELLKMDAYAPELVQRRDHKGRDALLTAIEVHNTSASGMILDMKPSLSTEVVPDNENYLYSGDTPLHVAIRKGTPVETIRQLLKHSQRNALTYRDTQGFTPATLLENLYDNDKISGERYLAVRKALKE